MSQFPTDCRLDNPFATRRVRPGTIPFDFPAGDGPEALLRRLAEHAWRGSIVGPHGSGKSTLLAAVLPALEAAGRRPRVVTLHQEQRRFPLRLDRRLAAQTRLLVVDGYEQLGWLSRWRLTRFCRRQGLGLLVTSHRSARGLPLLLETRSDLAQCQALVERLQAGWPTTVAPAEVAASFARHAGNVREVFMELYDLYESRRGG